MNSPRKWTLALALTGVLALGVAACGDDDSGSTDGGGDSADFSGESITIDGSSTVAPLTTLVSESWSADTGGDVTVGTSGTGGGFEKFCVGETNVSDASRQIDEEEIKICEENGIEYTEMRVALDGVTLMVNPENPVECLTDKQLKAIWEPGSKISNWNDIPDLDVDFDQEMTLYSPGADSGTFDTFTEIVNGEGGEQRTDSTVNDIGEDDNQTVRGVQDDVGAMGYAGLSFANENSDSVRPMQIDKGEGCVEPSDETVQDDSYLISRSLYIYPENEWAATDVGKNYLSYYLDNVNTVDTDNLFVDLTEEQLQETRDAIDPIIGG